jgi:hypothetical protein
MRYTSSLATLCFLSSLTSLVLADCVFWNGDGVWGPEYPLKQGAGAVWESAQFRIDEAQYDLKVEFRDSGTIELSSKGSFGSPVPFHQFKFDVHLGNEMGTRSFWSATDKCSLRVDSLDTHIRFHDYEVDSVSVYARQ